MRFLFTFALFLPLSLSLFAQQPDFTVSYFGESCSQDEVLDSRSDLLYFEDLFFEEANELYYQLQSQYSHFIFYPASVSRDCTGAFFACKAKFLKKLEREKIPTAVFFD